MADAQKQPQMSPREIEALARETGCTESQIREIVSLVGFDRASILREARSLRQSN
ncbi:MULTISPECIES: DUF3606 domain-containing protein [unclassified Mesorhizobium]|uniref:DUF3606 domain-containing protein n=1 Tax=unclassified Mesorhizobium TaxID=325217 RepID=UPI000F750AEF|nr:MULTISPECIES: DUF3606 domain-containing protein [unclassified Mesorhizobium]RUX09586.1 DUF3606 domain-containing protein [Mesorhizobium sp. M8A.F.Ca.ET.059.01.1.1]TGW04440.1 DUF3606 domain-containing protein [Mesorhizobium sp. M2D.F.Ca.ET.145.01.1.1]AZO55660.1 DUF3606 domain-containing protein [Mesorhizobium sp. M8A.F.Ca.ET.057.01.1.1]RUW53090.1 DUF3606 domain-containing protein [Mesorhizobium sp. M8A.F.Ca.ET.021.01.1.1]RWE41902.1 MAG: DUF3606 domain-containing protein [Mesorhizobium sp.]